MSRRSLSQWWRVAQRSLNPGHSRRSADTAAANRCRLQFERLERRALLAVLTVNTTVDENDGVGVGGISLRDAIVAAAPNDTINFSVTGRITLEHGQLLIDKNLTINGPGANLFTIRATNPEPDSPPPADPSAARVFLIDDGNFIPDKTVSISGLTLTSGNVTGSGGAILNAEALTVTGSSIRRNEASGDGGGIYNTGELTIVGSTVSGNYTPTGAGGGIASVGNFALTSSTVSGNTASGQGGGIRHIAGNLTIAHSTIADNKSSIGLGSGISVDGSGTRGLSHTIVARNESSDIEGPVTASYSLIRVDNGLITDTGGSQIGTSESPLDPKLGPLTDNGGSTFTYALLQGSPAIDAGDAGAIAGVAGVPQFDQRGNPFGRVKDGNDFGGSRIDIGAYEQQSLESSLTFVVDTLLDESDGNYAEGDFSLREAIQLANSNLNTADTITFSSSLAGHTILLTLGDLNIGDSLTIQGLGSGLLTIDASVKDPTPNDNNGDGSRIFSITDGKEDSFLNVAISGLTLTGGDRAGNGGAIENKEHLTLTDCKITGNSARGDGGGIWSKGGDLKIVQSTISGNTSQADYGGYGGGGGIAAFDYLSIVGSAIFSNMADNSGGGVLSESNLKIIDSTISGNSVQDNTGSHAGVGQGGGIRLKSENDSAIRTIAHSTIAGNQAPAGQVGGNSISGGQTTTLSHTIVAGNSFMDIDGAVNASFSLIGVNSGLVNNVVGTLIGVDPLLGPLADNGGPTKTHALLPGSPAINAGDPAAVAGVGDVPQYDQRGAPFTRVSGGHIDIGAVERQPIPPAFYGDYNQNGVGDAADYVVWRNSLGQNVAPYSGADGDGNGTVNQNDNLVWRAHFGQSVPLGSGAGASLTAAASVASASQLSASAEVDAAASQNNETSALHTVAIGNAFRLLPPAEPGAAISNRAVTPAGSLALALNRRDEALVAWLASRIAEVRRSDDSGLEISFADEPPDESSESVEAAFAEMAIGV